MAEKKDDGGRAFPCQKPLDHWGDPDGGMSLRDWFAGQALAGLCHNVSPEAVEALAQGMIGGKFLVLASLALADKMLEARK